MTTPRYAIYYAAAPDSALHRFGSAALGYDAYTGEDLPFPHEIVLSAPDWRDITRDPRKYGFHATLKAPMVLAPDRTEAELITACDAFASTARRMPRIIPVVAPISGFIAVIPERPSAELDCLAADCTRNFDSFRAPLTSHDRARRNPEQLTPRQREYLDRWGYPHVMEEFRFHMTLTGRLPEDRRDGVVAMLRKRFASTCIETLVIDRIALFRQDDPPSRFSIIRSWPLRELETVSTAPTQIPPT